MSEYKPKQVDHSVNRGDNIHPLKDFMYLLLGVISLTAIVFTFAILFADFITQFISLEQEIKIANSLDFSDKSFSVSKKGDYPDVEKYLFQLTNELWEPYREKNISQLKTHIKNDSIENAFMTLGGNALFTKEFLKNVKSENELSFVICHEIGHFIHRDVIRGLSRGLVINTIKNSLGLNEISFLDYGVNASLLKFSRDQETSSDLFALDCLNRKYNSVVGYSDFFNRMKNKEKQNSQFRKLIQYSSTHPLSDDRIQTMQKFIEQNNLDSNKDKIPLPNIFKLL